MILLEFSLVLLSLFLISLAIKRHKKQVLKKLDNKIVLNALIFLGWTLLLFSAFLFVYNHDLGIGLTYWFGIISLNSFLIAFVYGRLKK